ncbi:MAG TPA: hypothetical protein VJC04_00970 [Candidatus Paceibacterota bacterium]
MTFSFYFYPEQLLFAFVKKSLITQSPDRNDNLNINAACIFCCVAATEAIVNSLFIENKIIEHYDEMGLRSKIETIALIGGLTIDWDKIPWLEINHLIKIRNWLTHYKISRDKSLGLANFDGWINKPNIDPLHEFTKNSVEKYYNSVRGGLVILVKGVSQDHNYSFLSDEKYESFLAG